MRYEDLELVFRDEVIPEAEISEEEWKKIEEENNVHEGL